MPLLRQVEFAFRIVAGIADPGRLGALQDAGVTAPGYNDAEQNLDLETTARELLRSLGAARIASELRVEWNSRLKTAAGRADYREKLISLNPQLVDHPTEIDRTLRLADGGFHLTALSGGRHVSIWESPTRSAVTICRFPCEPTPPGSSIAVQIVFRSSRGCAACAAQSPVLPAAVNTTAAGSIHGFGYSR